MPVPYANLSNPQTLNLYAMVSDNPETFADLDGHDAGGFDDSGSSGSPAAATASPGDQDQQPTTGTPQNVTAQPPKSGSINVAPDHKNPVTGKVDVQSGVRTSFQLTTDAQLSPGKSTLTVTLTDSNGKDIKTGGDTSLRPEIIGDVKNSSASLVNPDGSVRSTTTTSTVDVRVTPISSNNDFGAASKSRSANLTFTIVDSKGTKFSGSAPASVAPKLSGASTGHEASMLPSLNRIQFTVP